MRILKRWHPRYRPGIEWLHDTNSKAKEIYDCYVKWCADNGYGIENKGNFFAEMKNKGLFATRNFPCD